MNCTECFHQKVCTYSPIGRVCEDFKDKSKIIELPCKVGDTVYCFIESISSNGCFIGAIKVETNEFIINNLGCFGKSVFLTKREAEKAIKELNKQ